MQQWIPRTQTLEPKIWGQIGLRQGLYMGLGVLGGIMFLFLLAPLGLAPRVAGALLALAAGVAAGFLRVKGLSPERYLWHRLRFALRRQGLGVWQVPRPSALRAQVRLHGRARQRRSRPRPAPRPAFREKGWARPATVAAAAPWGEYTVEASPFGLGFTLAALSAIGVAAVYLSGVPIG